MCEVVCDGEVCVCVGVRGRCVCLCIRTQCVKGRMLA